VLRQLADVTARPLLIIFDHSWQLGEVSEAGQVGCSFEQPDLLECVPDHDGGAGTR